MTEFTILQITVAALNVIFFYTTLWFLISLLVDRNDVADMAWGLGITFVAMICYVAVHVPDPRIAIMAGLTFMWGTRLTLHITKRYLRSSGEDYRYKTWRTQWHPWFMPRSYTQVFLLQGFLMVVIGYPFIHAARFTEIPWGFFETLGVLVWILGFTIEAVADSQLRTFIRQRQHPGMVCDVGLWRYSRHPNYFGEALMWWGISSMVVGVPWGLLALVSPITITYLLRYVSGVPLVERKAMETPAYREYAKRTPAFIPNVNPIALWRQRRRGTI